MNAKQIISARIEDLNAELLAHVSDMEYKKTELGNPSSVFSVSDITQYLQNKTLQVMGIRCAVAELKKVQEML